MDTLPVRPDFEVRAPKERSTLKTVLIVLGVVFAVLVILGAIVNMVGNADKLAGTEDRLTASQAQAAELRDKIGDLNSELGLANQDAEDARATIDQQSGRLRYCAQAISIGVKMDGVLNDLVDNALYNGSLSQWISLQNRYSTLGADWEDAAAACSPAGGYTFS